MFLFNITTDDLEDSPEDPGNDTASFDPPSTPDAGEDFVHSTPVRLEPDLPSQESPESPDVSGVFYPGEGVDFYFLPNARNVRRRIQDQVVEVPQIVEVPAESHHRTQARWKDKPVEIFKYVDDGLIVDKVNMDTGVSLLAPEGKKEKRMKHAAASQNSFRTITTNATRKGMKVNTLKTNLLCIDDSMSYVPEVYIEDGDGNEIREGNGLKLLGFHFSTDATVNKHVEVIRKKMRRRYWVLYNLQSHGFTEDELIAVYKSVLRPIVEYLAAVYHSMLTDELDEIVERMQSHALRIIYGWGVSARKMREKSGLPTLRERRIELTDKFARKCLKNPRFARWFPSRDIARSTRTSNQCPFLETTARCERLRNSPVHYMRRRLNGKPGKTYGSRNKEYRED